MNYEPVYQTLKTRLQALIPDANIRFPNRPPVRSTELDIDVSIVEIDSSIYSEEHIKRDVSINILLSVPISTGTQRIHNAASKIAKAFNPLQFGNFWTDQREYFVRIKSAGQRNPNISDTYQINVRILATIET